MSTSYKNNFNFVHNKEIISKREIYQKFFKKIDKKLYRIFSVNLKTFLGLYVFNCKINLFPFKYLFFP